MNENLVQASTVQPSGSQAEQAAPRKRWVWPLIIFGILFSLLFLWFVLSLAPVQDVGLRCCAL